MNVPIRALILALAAVFTISVCERAGAQDKNFIVVIDPGHGGKDPGAVYGKSVYEKDINLAVALRLGELIDEGMPDAKVVYTRSGDTYPTLKERGDIANKAAADIFLSIHSDASDKPSAKGSSTWIMGVDEEKNEANLELAMRENKVIMLEEGYKETYMGFDPSSAESYIVFQLMQSAHFDSSLRMAEIIQKHYASSTAMVSRGARQNILMVLWNTTMPSVLTELGFISNAEDRGYMTSSKGQDKLARALYDALCEYRGPTGQVATGSGTGVSASGAKTSVATKTSTEPINKPSARPVTKFYIQLVASRTKIPSNSSEFGPYRGKVVERSVDGWYKYSLGPFEVEADAKAKQTEVRNTKFKEAFITKITE